MIFFLFPSRYCRCVGEMGVQGGVMTGRCGGLLGTCVEKGRVGKEASEYTAEGG
jgi:hypothetical protein